MSSWPIHSDYSMMVQNPKIAFRDRELKACRMERDDIGQPRVLSGAFAVVYKAKRKNGAAMAVRAFTSESLERRERYGAVSRYLAGKRVTSLVPFHYTNDGIRSKDGKWYPLVTMEWVSGCILFDYIRDKCLKGDRRSLDAVAKKWVALVEELGQARIAHGDLQHANIMVTDAGELRLVDYDCMCVPELVGRQNLEIGVEPYQHPERGSATKLGLDLDHFSSLFILVALRALSAKPALWRTHVEACNYDKLLIKKEDLELGLRSDLFQAILKTPDEELHELVHALLVQFKKPLAKVPPLRELLQSHGKVETLLNQKHWDEAIELLSHRKSDNLPAHLLPRVAEAKERVASRLKLERALASGNEQAVITAYQPRWLDDYPRAQPSVQAARQTRKVVAVLDQINQCKAKQAFHKLVAIVDENLGLLRGRIAGDQVIREAETWRERNRLCTVIEQLVGVPNPNIQLVSKHWDRLQALGGHPELSEKRLKLEGLHRRAVAWHALQAIPDPPGSTRDRKLLEAWKEDLFRGWTVAEVERPLLDAARTRLATVQRLSRLQTAEPCTHQNIKQVIQEASRLPASYGHECMQLVDRARSIDVLLQELQTRCIEPASDLAIAETARALDSLKARSLIPMQLVERVALAERRQPAIMQLRAIGTSLPPDQLDSRIQAVWQSDLLDSCPDAAAWKLIYYKAIERRKRLQELAAALRARDDNLVLGLLCSYALKDYPLPGDMKVQAELVLKRSGVPDGMFQALENGDRAYLLRHLDYRLVNRYPSVFLAHRAAVERCLVNDIRSLEVVGLLPRRDVQGLILSRAPTEMYKVRWEWPAARFCDSCLLAVCTRQPQPEETPLTDGIVRHAWRICANEWRDAGNLFQFDKSHEMQGMHLVVWAILDWSPLRIGHSEPLYLGKLDSH